MTLGGGVVYVYRQTSEGQISAASTPSSLMLKKILFFEGAKGPFLGLIPLIPEKKKPFLCFVVFRLGLIPKKKHFP